MRLMLLILCILTGCELGGVDTRPRKHYVCVAMDGMCDGEPSGGVYSVCAQDADLAEQYVLEDLNSRAEKHCTTWDFPRAECTIYEEDKYCDI